MEGSHVSYCQANRSLVSAQPVDTEHAAFVGGPIAAPQPVDTEAERVREALGATNTTGKCDHCGDPVVSYGKGRGPLGQDGEAGEYCACTTRRGCAHRAFRDCPVCAVLSGKPVDTEAERLLAALERYGAHEPHCLFGSQPLFAQAPCTCGLHDLIPHENRAALSGEAGDPEAERVRERARERRG